MKYTVPRIEQLRHSQGSFKMFCCRLMGWFLEDSSDWPAMHFRYGLHGSGRYALHARASFL